MMPVKTPGVPKMVSIPGGQYQQQYMDMMNNRFENAESENSSTPNFGVDSTNFGLLTKEHKGIQPIHGSLLNYVSSPIHKWTPGILPMMHCSVQGMLSCYFIAEVINNKRHCINLQQ